MPDPSPDIRALPKSPGQLLPVPFPAPGWGQPSLGSPAAVADVSRDQSAEESGRSCQV